MKIGVTCAAISNMRHSKPAAVCGSVCYVYQPHAGARAFSSFGVLGASSRCGDDSPLTQRAQRVSVTDCVAPAKTKVRASRTYSYSLMATLVPYAAASCKLIGWGVILFAAGVSLPFPFIVLCEVLNEYHRQHRTATVCISAPAAIYLLPISSICWMCMVTRRIA